MNLKKILLLSVISCVSVYILYVFILFVLAFGHSTRPCINVPNELKVLSETFGKETKSADWTFFEVIDKKEYNNCNALLKLHLLVNNDSISKSKESIDNYVNTVNKRVNEKLKDKRCLDSLIILVTSDYSKAKIDSLKSKSYRYSFPIK